MLYYQERWLLTSRTSNDSVWGLNASLRHCQPYKVVKIGCPKFQIDHLQLRCWHASNLTTANVTNLGALGHSCKQRLFCLSVCLSKPVLIYAVRKQQDGFQIKKLHLGFLTLSTNFDFVIKSEKSNWHFTWQRVYSVTFDSFWFP
jgi:hypothetical protein